MTKERKPDDTNPREDRDKIKPFKDPDLRPDKRNPINPETDEPTEPKKEGKKSKNKNSIQENPGEQITS